MTFLIIFRLIQSRSWIARPQWGAHVQRLWGEDPPWTRRACRWIPTASFPPRFQPTSLVHREKRLMLLSCLFWMGMSWTVHYAPGLHLRKKIDMETCSLQPGRLPGVDVPQSTYCSEGVANFDPSWLMKITLILFPQPTYCSEEVAFGILVIGGGGFDPS